MKGEASIILFVLFMAAVLSGAVVLNIYYPGITGAAVTGCGTTISASDELTGNLNCTGINAYDGVIISGSSLVFDCHGYAMSGTTTYKGIILQTGNGNAVQNCIITGFDWGVNPTTNNTFINTSITNAGTNSLLLGANTNSTFLNCSYADSTVSFGSGAVLYRKWFLIVNISNSAGNALSGANVSVFNMSADIFYNRTTAASGLIIFNVTDYVETSTGKTFYNNYTVNVTLTGYDRNQIITNVSGSKKVDIQLSLTGGADGTAPSWSLNETNATIGKINQDVTFNITIADNVDVDEWIFSWNGTGQWNNASNGTLTGTITSIKMIANKTIGIAQGNNIAYLWYAKDSSNNWNQSLLRAFTVQNTDPSQPTISYPVNGIRYNLTSVNYTATDDDSDTITYHLFVNNTYNQSNTANITNFVSADGYFCLNVTADDRTLNSTNSSSICFTLDTTAPATPTGLLNNTQSYWQINYTWTANTEDDYNYTEIWFGNLTNFRFNSTTSGTTFNASGLLNNSEYNISIRAVDTLGHKSAFTTNLTARTYTIPIGNAAPTGCVISYPVNGKNYSAVDINYTCTDADNDALKYYVLINNTLNQSGIAGNVSTWTAADGFYNIIVHADDGTANSSNSSRVDFRLDATAPSWSLNGTNASEQGRYKNVYFDITVDDSIGLSYWIFSWNGTGTWDNLTNGTLTGTSSKIIANKSIGILYGNVIGYRFFANDSTGNWNKSLLRIFSVGLYCGDGSCNDGETCSSCNTDCGNCQGGGGGGGGTTPVTPIPEPEPIPEPPIPEPEPIPEPPTPEPQPQTPEELAEDIAKTPSGDDYFLSNYNNTKKAVEIERTVEVNNETNTTKVNLTIIPDKVLYNFSYYEKIPKCIALLIREGYIDESGIKFNNPNFEIVEEDPLIVWRFAEVREPIDLSYEINKALIEECIDLLQGFGIAEKLGAVIEKPSPFLRIVKLMSPAALIPIVAFLIIYFGNFSIPITAVSSLKKRFSRKKNKEQKKKPEKPQQKIKVIVEPLKKIKPLKHRIIRKKLPKTVHEKLKHINKQLKHLNRKGR